MNVMLSTYLEQTCKFRRGAKRSALIIDDTLCEHVGDLFEFIDNHYDHTTLGYIWAHNPVTSHYVSGRVRFPLDFRLYRRYEEFTDWENVVHKYFPEVEIPRKKKLRDHFKKEVEATLLQDPLFRKRHEGFKTKLTFAKELVKMAIELHLLFSLVLFDGGYLAPALLELLASLHLEQYLGVGEYQMRKMLAIQNHGYLVFLSYSLLHLDIMNSSLEKGKNRLQTIGEACRQQSQALVKSLVLWVHRQLSKGIRMETIMDTLYPKSSKLCIA